MLGDLLEIRRLGHCRATETQSQSRAIRQFPQRPLAPRHDLTRARLHLE